jgi:Flp pilus assembly protein TadD
MHRSKTPVQNKLDATGSYSDGSEGSGIKAGSASVIRVLGEPNLRTEFAIQKERQSYCFCGVPDIDRESRLRHLDPRAASKRPSEDPLKPMRSPLLTLLALSVLSVAMQAGAQQIRIPLPKKSKYTPVQALNRDGVAALKKHDISKAKRAFYKAYLIDPNDPFTLNNLGYVAELEGNLDRAQRYYDQAQANTSEAVIDRSTAEEVQGKPVAKIAGHTAEGPMKVNQLNSEALGLLHQDRAPEADVVLQQALKIDPNNPFTLNNLGFAKEKEGEIEEAIRYYDRSAATGSREPIVIAFNKDWRGKPISEVAARNAEESRKELSKAQNLQDQVARLNLRGVSAMNRNDRKTAREDFEKAYKLDPNNSFTINNMGYLAELEGDKETAQSYYDQARRAKRASAKIVVSTRPEVEGHPVGQVAEQSTALVESSFAAQAESRRRSGAVPALRTRDNRIVVEPKTPVHPSTDFTPPEYRQPQPNNGEEPVVATPQSDQPPQQQGPVLKTRPPQQQQQPNSPPPNSGSEQNQQQPPE